MFILGSADPEMRAIESLLSARGIRFAKAVDRRGNPVGTGNAYEACGAVLPSCRDGSTRDGSGWIANRDEWGDFVLVECSVPSWGDPLFVIDHHNPGDPGWGMGPDRFLAGSSLGQAFFALGAVPDEGAVLTAAADHCLTAAYQGMCPGVDPEALLVHRAAWKACTMGTGTGAAVDLIMKASSIAKDSFDERLGHAFFDNRDNRIPLLAEGAAHAGVPLVYIERSRDGRLKEMGKGFCHDETERLIGKWVSMGRRAYGNPHRGYAGSYIQTQ